MNEDKLYKREFTISLYCDNPDEIPTQDELHKLLDENIGSRGVDICTTEHKWADNPDDAIYNCEIESLSGEVHIEGCELEEHDIWCVAADPEWRAMNVLKLKDLVRTRQLFRMLLDSPTEDNDVKIKVKREIERMDEEIKSLRVAIG